jgi:hypothetical protein
MQRVIPMKAIHATSLGIALAGGNAALAVHAPD